MGKSEDFLSGMLVTALAVLLVLKLGNLFGFGSVSWGVILTPLWIVPVMILGLLLLVVVIAIVVILVGAITVIPFKIYKSIKNRKNKK